MIQRRTTHRVVTGDTTPVPSTVVVRRGFWPHARHDSALRPYRRLTVSPPLLPRTLVRRAAPRFRTAVITSTLTLRWSVDAPTDQSGQAGVVAAYPGYLDPAPPSGFCPAVAENPFRRLIVDYLVRGGARVSWELHPNFLDEAPHTFQLQASFGAGTRTADDWVDVGPSVTNTFYLVDDTQRLFGAARDLAYRVRLTTSEGTYTSPVEGTLGLLTKHDWLIVRDVARQEQLRHKLFTNPGWLLKARRYGTRCSCRDELTGLGTCGECTDCYGVGFVGGYFPAVPCHYSDVPPEESREFRGELGMEKKVTVLGRFPGWPTLVQPDAWVARGSDERYHVHKVRERSAYKSVPLVQVAELRLAPHSDILYRVPLT